MLSDRYAGVPVEPQRKERALCFLLPAELLLESGDSPLHRGSGFGEPALPQPGLPLRLLQRTSRDVRLSQNGQHTQEEVPGLRGLGSQLRHPNAGLLQNSTVDYRKPAGKSQPRDH